MTVLTIAGGGQGDGFSVLVHERRRRAVGFECGGDDRLSHSDSQGCYDPHHHEVGHGRGVSSFCRAIFYTRICQSSTVLAG